ncbi:fatty acid desaturase [Shewanella sp. C32]|uniref:Fatty acid desaturase n=1 Tax=Shewanella electrica TaxID=515560 RepID=A0ABT2FMB7_9GAMM|nr:fatty acid desaturase [Shewanella electrica]MCH1925912.1 fatty acid desaturase [Shewanella electrica]MCS4557482.1 fatty acid desaturase [Shewanella electrica]
MNKPRILWLNVIFFTVTLVGALVWVPWHGVVNGFDGVEWLTFIVLVFASGMSITGGYHRLWSHKAYKAHPIVRFAYALGGALAFQNSALHWASDHRVHHKHVDVNDKDPYSANKGFWFSHIGWMLREYQPERYNDYQNARDLQNDRIVMWQHRNYLWLALLMNIGLPALLGWFNGDVLSMVLLAGLLRLVIVHHCTFFINSLAHVWGSQPYTDRNTARDNGILAVLTYGEGYHNFHHIFEHDYRNGIRWWHYDPTKWLIKALSWVKLATDLRQVPDEKIETAKLQMQLKHTQHKLSRLPNAEQMLAQLQHEYELLKQHLTDYYLAKKALLEAKGHQLKEQDLHAQAAQLRQAFYQQLRRWQQYTAHIA